MIGMEANCSALSEDQWWETIALQCSPVGDWSEMNKKSCSSVSKRNCVNWSDSSGKGKIKGTRNIFRGRINTWWPVMNRQGKKSPQWFHSPCQITGRVMMPLSEIGSSTYWICMTVRHPGGSLLGVGNLKCKCWNV